ncbi:MAG: transglycosylase family protein [Frankiaceae bacterium]
MPAHSTGRHAAGRRSSVAATPTSHRRRTTTRAANRAARTDRRLRRGIAVAATAASLVTVDLIGAAAASAAIPSSLAGEFAALRQCESGGNYRIATGNGYYGAYQFDLGTWRGIGGSGYPNQASPATQDALAYRLYQQRGWAPWPACSAHLGLRSGSSISSGSHRASRSTARPALTHGSPYAGVVLSTRFVSQYRSDVRAMQSRLLAKGYQLAVDGYYGPQTRSRVVAFQRAAGIAVDGVAGPQTFGALF